MHSEGAWRLWLRAVAGLTDDRIAREVRSEEHGYRIASPGGGRSNVVTYAEAIAGIDAAGPVSRATRKAVPVTVRRIRRVQP